MENHSKKCRLCLRLRKKDGINIFEKNPDLGFKISTFIEVAFMIQLEDIPGHPPEICTRCHSTIKRMVEFKDEISKAQSTWVEWSAQKKTLGSELQPSPDKLSIHEEEHPSHQPDVPDEDIICESESDNQITKKERSPEKSPRQQPSRRIKKEPTVAKRNVRSPYSLEEEMSMEAQMKDLGLLTCHKCSVGFPSAKEMNRHFKETHKTYGYIECCNGRRRLGCEAFHHMKYHTKVDSHKCETCGKTFIAKANLTKHIRIRHSGPNAEKYPCKYCDKVFGTLGIRNHHLKVHTKPAICSTCGKGFSGSTHLRRHVETTHEKTAQIICYICAKVYANKDAFACHLNQHNKKPCPHCGKLVADMAQHIRVVHMGSRRGGVIRIPGLDSQGRPLDHK